MNFTSLLSGRALGKGRHSSVVNRLKKPFRAGSLQAAADGPGAPYCHYCGKPESPAVSVLDRCACDTSTAPW